MNYQDCIKNRRSIRDFQSKTIAKETFEELIALAAYAPSWKNTQTTRYLIVEDQQLKERVAKECVMNFKFNEDTILNAPAIIVVTNIRERSGYERDGSFSTRKEKHWESFDAGIATQTLSLAAYGLGLGSVVLGIFDEDLVRKVLEIDDHLSISAIVAIGYAKSIPEAPKRKDVSELYTIK